MQEFNLLRPKGMAEAAAVWRDGDAFIAGGTDLLQLMKNGVATPRRVIDLGPLGPRRIAFADGRLELGALCTMAETAAHDTVRNEFPAISMALLLSASPQVRNMGTVGGNLLQRTRCGYFRDTGFPCEKRQPGSGCPALRGDNRELAIFGGGSRCIATHPSDLPVALMALDAELDLVEAGGKARRLKLAKFYRLPGDTPQIETALRPGEVIAKVHVPAGPLARNSTYVKVRDRASFSFALVSAAVGLDVANGTIRDARVALGGVAASPWRLPQVEAALRGQSLDSAVLDAAAARAGDGAIGAGRNDFKIELARRTVSRALHGLAERGDSVMNIGQSIDRQDARRKVLGRAVYAAEFRMPDLARAVLVQSTVAAGEIAAIDTGPARAMPGVLAVITSDNADKLRAGGDVQQAVRFPLLQSNDILYNGQHIAIVVAETLQRAQAAAEKVSVRYRAAQAVTAIEDALDQAYTPKTFDNGRSKPDTKIGDPDAAMTGAAARVEATYTTPIEHHNPMEPHATIAAWQGDKLTVWTATQGISGARETLAGLFGLQPENVTIICPFVGGGFGCKGNTWPHVALTAMAARQVDRPVKLELTRQQMFTSNGYRPRTIQKLALAADAQGKLLAIRHDAISQMSRPELGEFTEAAAKVSRMLYACDNISTSHRAVSVNQGLPTYMRAPGEASGNFALESAMDELAVALRIDPLALRLRNYADTDPTSGQKFASKGLRECYQRGADAFGWSRRTPEPGSMRDGGTLIGMGMATATYPTNRMPASAQVRLLPDGTAEVASGTQDLGTGTYTTMAQVAGDELGLPVERVRVELGDSRLPKAPVSGGSMTTASVLPSVRDAAAQVREQIFALAIERGGEAWRNTTAAALKLQGGWVTGPAGPLSVADLMGRAGVRFVEAVNAAKPDQAASQYSRHAFGAQFAEVRIDPDLRTIRVSRFVGAFDCGKVINAKTARSQLIGGIVFGIGMALLEETRVDPAFSRTLNSNIADYLVPVNADVPDIETIAVEAPDLVTTPLGVKGIGELPMVGVAAAIANAVYHATGTRVRELPVRLDKLLV